MGPPNDRFEQEAERAAKAVLSMSDRGPDAVRAAVFNGAGNGQSLAPDAGAAAPPDQGSHEPAARDIIRRQTDTDPPVFPDFPALALRIEEDVGSNLLDYGHHLYRISTLYPGRSDLLEEAFGRYALGANVIETGFGFLGLDETAAERLALGSGILFKGINFATAGELILDFQFDIGHGLKLETSLDLAVDPDNYGEVRKAEVGLGVVGHF